MRIINLIVVHYSATRGDCTLFPETLGGLYDKVEDTKEHRVTQQFKETERR